MYTGQGNGWLNRDTGPPVCLSMMHGGAISFLKSGQATDAAETDSDAMVDFVTLYGKEDVRFTFKNGRDVPTKTE